VAAAEATGAERLLAELQDGETPSLPDPNLHAALAAARQRVERAASAREIARTRRQEVLQAGRVELAAELRPLLAEALAEAAAVAAEAAERNDWVRLVAEFGQANGAGTPAPWDAALSLPTRASLNAQVAARRNLFTAPAPAAMPPGVVLIRWLAPIAPYNVGEQAGLDRDEAQLQVRAGNAELVDPARAKELGLTDLVHFDAPTTVRLVRDFTPRQGAMIPAGTVQTFPPDVAARIVNLHYGELARD
jgi:hypothetical protein